MTQRALGIIALKILGVLCIIRSLQYLGGVIGLIIWPRDTFFQKSTLYASSVFPFLILLIVAYLLIRYAEGISAFLFPSDQSVGEFGGMSAEGWYKLAFTVIGAVLLVLEIPSNVAQLVGDFSTPMVEVSPDLRVRIQWAGWILLLRTIIQFSIGLYLVLGSDHLVQVIKKFKGGKI